MKTGLFWWSSRELYGKGPENYGDLLSKYLVEKISGGETVWVQPKKIKWYHSKKQHIVAIGSIIAHVSKHSRVWGSGIISKNDKVAQAEFLAVRGPETRKRILELGYTCPEVYGDPGILLPKFLDTASVDKKYKIGIIPHYVDFELVSEWYKEDTSTKVINLRTDNIEATTGEICSCEQIVSSSLHGVIISHAYQIPAIWVQFSDKLHGDNIKFKDYFDSVKLHSYQPKFVDQKLSKEALISLVNDYNNLPLEKTIEALQEGLMKSFPQ
ncbi:MAG: polysaccharide pyruvyl transferase family protein [Flavobacteriaceae bacterium]|nr:polysaccharide pyruvyl transferase family protein [Flavobacteriaceae bacterium]